MLVVAAILMIAQSLLAQIPYWHRSNGGPAKPVLGAIGLVLQLFTCASLFMVVHYIALWMLGAYCLRRHARQTTYLAWSLALVPFAAVFAGVIGLEYFDRLRERYPIESLAQRLDYERAGMARQAAQPQAVTIEAHPQLVSEQTSRSLDDLYQEFAKNGDAEYRAARLKSLHTEHVQQFVNSPGFGVVRGMALSERSLRINREPGTPEQLAVPPLDDATPETGPPPAKQPPIPELLAQLRPMHDSALGNFANPAAFGWVQDVDHVAGFEPHALHNRPRSPPARNDSRLELLRVELVSLLKHDQPMVYDSKFLPDMQELRNMPVRPLDRFERQALPRLQSGNQDLVSEARGPRVRLLGSIRAAKQCLECHSVSHGDLLGAFSYQLLDKLHQHTEPQEAPPETF
jgi:hypothetical protein